MTTRDVLVKARELIAEPERWTQGTGARTAGGAGVSPLSPDATCWCLEGAIARARPSLMEQAAAYGAFRGLVATGPGAIAEFNDMPGRKHAEVLAVLDRAIERCEGR